MELYGIVCGFDIGVVIKATLGKILRICYSINFIYRFKIFILVPSQTRNYIEKAIDNKCDKLISIV